MNITRENIDELNAVVKVDIAKEDYSDKVENILKDYRKNANIPGFRKGHVPMGMVKKQYGKAVLVDEVNKLLQDALNKYLTEEKLDVLGNPLPKEQENFDWDSETYTFEFELGLSPQFEVNLDTKKPITHYKIVAGDEMIENQIKTIQKQHEELHDMLCHELRNQLLVISGLSSRMAESHGLAPDKYRSYACAIKKSSSFLYSLAEEILLISELENGNYPLPSEEVRLEETARQIISVFSHHAKEKGIYIEFEKTGEIPRMRLNMAGLKICLSCLIENAIKYSEAGGSVTIEGWQEEAQVTFKVQDRGQGIPKSHLPSLFERFYRVDAARSRAVGGTGLGLAIVKHIGQAHKGDVTVHSVPEEGSVFTISLPVS